MMIVSEEQVRNVLKIHYQLQAENKNASRKPKAETVLPDLSSRNQEIKFVKVSLADSSDIRKERVAALKDNIAKGKYQPTAIHIASKMVNRSLVDNTLVKVNFHD
ncbi:MAG: flagellar biosynthesis anti-sigma factor FlgM [Bacteroidota bacterium]